MKNFREAEILYRILFDQSPYGILVVDLETKAIIKFNDAACAELGYTRDEFSRMQISDFEAMETPEEIKRHIAEIERRGGDEFNTKYYTKQGEIRDHVVLARPIEISGKRFLLSIHHDITERRRAEQALVDETTRRRILIEQSKDGIVVLDQNGKVYEANQRFAEMLRYLPEEVRDLYVWDWDFQYPPEQLKEMLRSVDEKGDHFETRHRRKDGTIYEVDISTNGAMFAGQKLIFCVCRDITERKKTEEELKLRARLLDNATDFIFLRDLEGNYIYVNETALKALGYSREEFLKLKVDQVVAPGYAWIKDSLMEDLMAKGTVTFENASLRKDGSMIPMETKSRLVETGDKKFILSIVRDITERKTFEETIRQLAYHDPLTGLPNRTLFNDHVTLALAHAARYDGRCALMMMDMDRFKDINDTLGHGAGDQILKEIASRLVGAIRKTDTVSRIGGDEFLLLISEMMSGDDTASIAQKILDVIREPFMIDGQELNITTSIGVAVYPVDGKDIDTLTKHADFAMYRVKREGRNGYLRYTPDMARKSSRNTPSAPLPGKKKP